MSQFERIQGARDTMIDAADALRLQMGRHIDEYIMFYRECRNRRDFKEVEILVLWKTWCYENRGGEA